MFTAETQIRVRYGETDQMGYLYYGHYALYYEVGRTEALRGLGYSYRNMEEMGMILVVTEFQCKYLRPARYDDLITVRTSIRQWPTGFKISFHSELLNQQDLLLNAGKVSLVLLDGVTRQKRDLPKELMDLLKPYFPNNSPTNEGYPALISR